MPTLPSGSDNRSEATTTELTTAQSTHANSDHETLTQQMFQQLRRELATAMGYRDELATAMGLA